MIEPSCIEMIIYPINCVYISPIIIYMEIRGEMIGLLYISTCNMLENGFVRNRNHLDLIIYA